MVAGVVLLLAGALIYLFGRLNWDLPFGRLPGDIRIQRDNFTFYFPLGTSILVSIFLTLLLNLLVRWLNRP